jgi:hypothetical protein
MFLNGCKFFNTNTLFSNRCKLGIKNSTDTRETTSESKSDVPNLLSKQLKITVFFKKIAFLVEKTQLWTKKLNK